jgi:Ni/Co efflux regulator RcnB
MRSILITAAALMVAAAPLAAAAGPNGPRERDRDEWREEHQDGRRGYERDRREARREHREYVREGWRGRPEWRSYGGPREGYWYAPGYGYRAVSRGVAWRRGGYVPASYRVLYVQEPAFYRLAPAPRGYRWVYGDGSFVLMALTTGLISSIVAMDDAPPPPRREEVYVRAPRAEEPVAVARQEDVWRGSDGQYHCRRSNGTTGLVIGGAVGALVGRELDGGRDRTAGTVIGAASGALLGREVDRGELRCR